MQYNAIVQGSAIIKVKDLNIRTKSNGFHQMKFCFDSSWDEYDKICTFINDATKVVVDVPDTNVVNIPWEVLETEGTLIVSVHGIGKTDPTKVVNTKMENAMTVLPVDEFGGLSPHEPSPDIYQAIIDLLAHAGQGQATTLEMQKTDTYIQYRVNGGAWTNIVAVADLKGGKGDKGDAPIKGTDYFDGVDGKNVELQVNSTHIQWRRIGSYSWIDLIALSALKGSDGTSVTVKSTNKIDGVTTIVLSDASGDHTITISDGTGGGGSYSGDLSFDAMQGYRFKNLSGTSYPGYLYSYTQKGLRATSGYTANEYDIPAGTKYIRASCSSSGGSDRVGYCFVDAAGNILAKPDFIASQDFVDVILTVPSTATKLWLNGGGFVSPSCEISVKDIISDGKWDRQFLSILENKAKTKRPFAWRPLDTGYFTFAFDDSLPDISDIADLFIQESVPCCFGAIPQYLEKVCNSGETVKQVMARAVSQCGAEVLQHGSGKLSGVVSTMPYVGIITDLNIGDEGALYSKFIAETQKLIDAGFNVRGALRVGGSLYSGTLNGTTYYAATTTELTAYGCTNVTQHPNLGGDIRTDKWVRLCFDYCDLYGVSEPYNQGDRTWIDLSSLAASKTIIDNAIATKKIVRFGAHATTTDSRLVLKDVIEYIKTAGGKIVNYGYLYDNFGATAYEVSLEARIKALESGTTLSGTAPVVTLSSISSTKTKTSYNVGDTLSVSDVVVTASYSDSTSATVTGWTSNATSIDMSTAGSKTLTITYVSGGVTKTANISLTVVNPALVLSSISAVKTKTAYNTGDTVSIADITVTATYSDSSSATVTGWTTNAAGLDMTTAGTKTLTITYTSNGVTKTYDIALTVTVAPANLTPVIISDMAINSGLTSLANSAGSKLYKYPVTDGGTYHLTMSSATGNVRYAFNNTGSTAVLTAVSNGVSKSWVAVSNLAVTIPAGMTYMYVSVDNTTNTPTLI